MTSTASTRDVVVQELRRLLVEEDSDRTTVADDDSLVDLGLDSLALAVLITRLEDALGCDPFLAIEQGAPPRTVGDLVVLYEGSVAAPPAAP